jgi:hypothetical protein
LAIATYHKKKLYIPKEVEDTLELSDGDQAEIQILDKKSFKVSLRQRKKPQISDIEKRMIERILKDPFSGKLAKQHFQRQDYYERS